MMLIQSQRDYKIAKILKEHHFEESTRLPKPIHMLHSDNSEFLKTI